MELYQDSKIFQHINISNQIHKNSKLPVKLYAVKWIYSNFDDYYYNIVSYKNNDSFNIF